MPPWLELGPQPWWWLQAGVLFPPGQYLCSVSAWATAGRELQEVADSLRQVLEQKEAVEQECQELQGWLETARQELHNSQEAAKGLKQQLAQLQGEHKRGRARQGRLPGGAEGSIGITLTSSPCSLAGEGGPGGDAAPWGPC